MKIKSSRYFYAALYVLFYVFSSLASEQLETDRFSIIAGKVEKLVSKYGASRIVVVFDIDNTILASNQSPGSDQWFTW